MPRQETSMSTLEPSPISRQWTMERQETLEPPFSRQCSMEFLDFESDFCRQCTIDSCFAVQVDVSCMKVMKVGEFGVFGRVGDCLGTGLSLGGKMSFYSPKQTQY